MRVSWYSRVFLAAIDRYSQAVWTQRKKACLGNVAYLPIDPFGPGRSL